MDKLSKTVELLDTPGILWPKFDSEIVGRNLALIGSMNDEVINIEDLAFEAVTFLKNNYSGNLSEMNMVLMRMRKRLKLWMR